MGTIIAVDYLSFIKKQFSFLNEKVCCLNGVTLAIGTSEGSFDQETFQNMKLNSHTRVDMIEKIDHYIKMGFDRNFFQAFTNTGEVSEYKSISTFFLTHKTAYISSQFVQEFKGKMLFNEFTMSSGTISLNNERYHFLELSSNWEDGVKNIALSFREILSNPKAFVTERCILKK